MSKGKVGIGNGPVVIAAIRLGHRTEDALVIATALELYEVRKQLRRLEHDTHDIEFVEGVYRIRGECLLEEMWKGVGK